MGRVGSSIIDESKKYINYFYVNEKFLDEPIKFKVNGRYVTDDVMLYLSRLFRFFIEGTMLNNCTVMWLTSNLGSVKLMIDNFNEQVVEIDRINLNTAQRKIQYDKGKLSKYFDDNYLYRLINYPEKNLDDAIEKLDSLLRLYMKDKEYSDSLILKLPKTILNKELDNEKWNKLKKVLYTYSKIKIEAIENNKDKDCTEEMIGYYNYLISNGNLSGEEANRLGEIRRILGLGGINNE